MLTPTQFAIATALILIFSGMEYFLSRRAGWLGLVLPLVVTGMGMWLDKTILFLLIPLLLFFLLGLRAGAARKRKRKNPAHYR